MKYSNVVLSLALWILSLNTVAAVTRGELKKQARRLGGRGWRHLAGGTHGAQGFINRQLANKRKTTSMPDQESSSWSLADWRRAHCKPKPVPCAGKCGRVTATPYERVKSKSRRDAALKALHDVTTAYLPEIFPELIASFLYCTECHRSVRETPRGATRLNSNVDVWRRRDASAEAAVNALRSRGVVTDRPKLRCLCHGKGWVKCNDPRAEEKIGICKKNHKHKHKTHRIPIRCPKCKDNDQVSAETAVNALLSRRVAPPRSKTRCPVCLGEGMIKVKCNDPWAEGICKNKHSIRGKLGIAHRIWIQCLTCKDNDRYLKCAPVKSGCYYVGCAADSSS